MRPPGSSPQPKLLATAARSLKLISMHFVIYSKFSLRIPPTHNSSFQCLPLASTSQPIVTPITQPSHGSPKTWTPNKSPFLRPQLANPHSTLISQPAYHRIPPQLWPTNANSKPKRKTSRISTLKNRVIDLIQARTWNTRQCVKEVGICTQVATNAWLLSRVMVSIVSSILKIKSKLSRISKL